MECIPRITVKEILNKENKMTELVVNIVFYTSLTLVVITGLIKFFFIK